MKEIIVWYLAGLFLLFLEIYLPGMIAGIAGGILMLVAGILSFQRFGATIGTAVIASEVLVGILLFIAWIKFFPKSSIGKKMALKPEIPEQSSAAELPQDLVGKTGTTSTFLRPSGIATIGGIRRDVIAEGAFIEPNSEVRVVNVEGSRIIVRSINK